MKTELRKRKKERKKERLTAEFCIATGQVKNSSGSPTQLVQVRKMAYV